MEWVFCLQLNQSICSFRCLWWSVCCVCVCLSLSSFVSVSLLDTCVMLKSLIAKKPMKFIMSELLQRDFSDFSFSILALYFWPVAIRYYNRAAMGATRSWPTKQTLYIYVILCSEIIWGKIFKMYSSSMFVVLWLLVHYMYMIKTVSHRKPAYIREF